MSKERDFVYKAYYKGGNDALRKFIKENLVYPKEAKANDIQGTVSLKFDIDHKGNVHHVKVISGIGYGCDEEAIRIAKLLKYEVPYTQKLKVGYSKRLNIHFKLSKSKVSKPSPISYTYSVSTSDQKTKGYSYSITIN